MANFGDQLRAAPAEEAKRQEIERNREAEEWYRKHLEKKRHIVDGAIKRFKEKCMEAAKQGKHSIDFKPDASRNSEGLVYVGYKATEILLGKGQAKKEALELVPEIEKELSTMGLRTYRVSTVDIRAISGYSTYHYIGFRIQASW